MSDVFFETAFWLGMSGAKVLVSFFAILGFETTCNWRLGLVAGLAELFRGFVSGFGYLSYVRSLSCYF